MRGARSPVSASAASVAAAGTLPDGVLRAASPGVGAGQGGPVNFEHSGSTSSCSGRRSANRDSDRPRAGQLSSGERAAKRDGPRRSPFSRDVAFGTRSLSTPEGEPRATGAARTSSEGTCARWGGVPCLGSVPPRARLCGPSGGPREGGTVDAAMGRPTSSRHWSIGTARAGRTLRDGRTGLTLERPPSNKRSVGGGEK
jgi:hypothetical protein